MRSTKQTGPVPAANSSSTKLTKSRRLRQTSPGADASPRPSLELEAPAASRSTPALTIVHAHVDIGFGNILYIRGQGDGLSWDQGALLQCVGPSMWAWTSDKPVGQVVFKLLINDEVWSQGEDWTAQAGERIDVRPIF